MIDIVDVVIACESEMAANFLNVGALFRQARVMLCLLAIAAGAGYAAPPMPAPPVHANGQALWAIVRLACLADLRDRSDPAPCSEVSIGDGVEHGYAVLKDITGASQYLLMPTVMITGIEDPRLLRPGATDYFTPAWRARRLVAIRLHAALPRSDVGIAINSMYGRSQDLLHLHVDCLSTATSAALRRAAPAIGYRWTRQSLALHGHRYRAVRIDGEDAVAQNPFRLLASGLHIAPAQMGAWTLVLAGMDYPKGKPGFVLLAARADPVAGFFGSGEELLDHACAILGKPG